MGGTGTGKSRIEGAAAAIGISTTEGAKAIFGGPSREQAARLSWLELLRACAAAREREIPLGVDPGVIDWYPQGKERRPDWFAACLALDNRNHAASVKGMLHAPRTFVVLNELEGVDADVRDALDAGTTQENSHYRVSFNPVD